MNEFSNLECVNEFILTKGNVLKLRLSNNYICMYLIPYKEEQDNRVPSARQRCERFNLTLHDLLRSLPPARKRRRPEYIKELVFSYNETPHSSTGYSPYFLMYGRPPNLPIDFLLGLSNSTSTNNISLDRWIEIHTDKLAFAYHKAKSEIQLNEEDRKQRHDAGKLGSELQIGDRVYLRNRGLKGRDKIQDKWKPEVYVIVGKPYESVYCVKCENRDAG